MWGVGDTNLKLVWVMFFVTKKLSGVLCMISGSASRRRSLNSENSTWKQELESQGFTDCYTVWSTSNSWLTHSIEWMNLEFQFCESNPIAFRASLAATLFAPGEPPIKLLSSPTAKKKKKKYFLLLKSCKPELVVKSVGSQESGINIISSRR